MVVQLQKIFMKNSKFDFSLKDCLISLFLVFCQHFPFFLKRYPVNGDDLEFGLAFTRVFYQQVESFSWGVSKINGYFPLVAEGQMGFFHPFRWLVYIFPPWPSSSDVLGIAKEYVFLLILCNFLMCYGMVSLLKFKGLKNWAIWIPTLIFCNYGFHQSQSTNINLILSSCILPWAAFSIDFIFSKIRKKEFPKKEILWLVFLLSSSFLSGQPQGSIIVLFILLIYIFSFNISEVFKVLKIFIFTIIASLLLSAPQIVSTYHLAQYSLRDSSFWGTQGGIEFKTLFNGFFPLLGLNDIASYDPVASSYLSTLWPLFLFFLFFRFRPSFQNNIYLTGIFLFLIFSWGPGYGVLVKVIPFLGYFRDFHRFMLGVLFFFCLYLGGLLKNRNMSFNRKEAFISFVLICFVFFSLSNFVFPESFLHFVLPVTFLYLFIKSDNVKKPYFLVGLFLILETFLGIFWRWNVRFYEYIPEKDIDFVVAEDCPSENTSVWFLDTYSENLKQESIDMKKPFAAYLGSPNGYLWDDPIFSNCESKPLRFQINSPLQSVWASQFQDFFIPSTGMEHPTVSDLIRLSEIWSRTKLKIDTEPDIHLVAGEVFYRYKREISTFDFQHVYHYEFDYFPEHKLKYSNQENEASVLANLFTGDVRDFLYVDKEEINEGVYFVPAWWYPGWNSEGKILPKVAYSFLGQPESFENYKYTLPGFPFSFYLSMSAFLLIFAFFFIKI